MAMTTTIKLQKTTRDNLIILKVKKGLQTLDKAINYLLSKEGIEKENEQLKSR